MNERIIELADRAVEDISSGPWNISDEFCIKFAELIVRECINTLEFHGFDDAVPYIKWMATNKLGVES